MMRILVLVAAALAAQASASWFDAGTTPNRFMVTYAPVPSFEKFSYYSMPRTMQEAGKMGFFQVKDRLSVDRTTVWCRMNDYRVCVMFDMSGSVAGLQLSVSVEDMATSPMDAANIPEWQRGTLLGQEVYTARVYFVSKETLLNGGRQGLSSADALTIPDGLYIQQTDAEGKETLLHVPADESGAEALGFKEQSCFIGMGKHYFQELTKTGSCENARPYFMLYNKKTHKLQGLGFTAYGKSSLNSRKWFETPPAVAAKMIAPNSPTCMGDWINTYGMFTLHVYFVDQPWFSRC